MAEDNPNAASPGEGSKGSVPWVPLILVLLFIPIITLVLVELVVIPRLRSSLAGDPVASGTASVPANPAADSGHAGALADNASLNTVQFSDIIANLSGTMGTRFMKVSFHVAGSDPQMPNLIQLRRPRVQDAIITTLSSITIQELEAAGGRNSLRVALIGAINNAIGIDVVEELYFTDFIIQ